MSFRFAVQLGWLLVLLACGSAHAAQVSATLDRDRVRMGEAVTLNVRVESAATNDGPDFSVLAKDFDILGTSSSQNISIRNGTVSKNKLWAVALRPLHSGVIEIPAMNAAGGMTSPLTLTVLGQVASGHGGPGDDVFVETSIEPASAYVGEQVLLSIRLYFAGALAQGSLDPPQIEGAELQQLGEDINYRAERDGRRYHVIERRYALIANQPGTLTVPGIGFRGQMQDGRYGGFFGGGRVVSARSEKKELVIKPIPATAGSGLWLPAQNLTLGVSGLPADGMAEVGVPITLTLTLQASGLPFEALPELSLPEIPGARVYPGQPTTSTSQDGRWLRGRRQRDFALVPTRPGSLTIPEISVPWWNTRADTAESARVPAHSLHIAAAPGKQASTPGPQAATLVDAASGVEPGVAGIDRPPPAPATLWRTIALAAVVLWLITLLAWWLRRMRADQAPVATQHLTVKSTTAKRAFRAASDVPAAAATLLAWARLERPTLRNLGELSAQLDSAEQRAAIAELERHRYGKHADALDVVAVQRVFRGGFGWRHNASAKETAGLPPLYPDSS